MVASPLNAVEYALHGDLWAVLVNRFRPSGPRRLLPRPISLHVGESARRINQLLGAFAGESRYLEIGVLRGRTFEKVRATYRFGVDPQPRFDVTRLPRRVTIRACTSDEFFSTLDHDNQFDVVFLDGLHTFEQTYRDLVNALQYCSSGFVLIDDVVPCDGASALPDQDEARRERVRRQLPGDPGIWHGDVFKVVVALSEYHSSQVGFCTIVGGGNPQTIAWREKQLEDLRPIGGWSLAELDSVSYEEVFKSGVPDFFVPKSEDAAIASALARRAQDA
jgi:hypothetical protein